MKILTRLEPYTDDAGNVIRYSGPPVDGVRIKIKGANNTLIVSRHARLGTLRIDFDNDNATVKIGASTGVPPFSAGIRAGQDSTVVVGKNVSSTGLVTMSAVEGTTIRIGDDVMIASENELRADDGHPIFDVRTRQRVNVSRSIVIGDHVWLARRSVCLGGTRIGAGSVVGYGAIVKGRFPNNVVIAGSPGRVVRKDIAWERPHLSMTRPFYKPDASTVKVTESAWNLTVDEQLVAPAPTPAVGTGRRLLGELRRRLSRGPAAG